MNEIIRSYFNKPETRKKFYEHLVDSYTEEIYLYKMISKVIGEKLFKENDRVGARNYDDNEMIMECYVFAKYYTIKSFTIKYKETVAKMLHYDDINKKLIIKYLKSKDYKNMLKYYILHWNAMVNILAALGSEKYTKSQGYFEYAPVTDEGLKEEPKPASASFTWGSKNITL